ncbi:ACT domain-containing protein [Pullulanibacillus sp. KACC 23026]|uniref:ACT domain-containing protein n=1 Tax=Pullulanibacillus sp. KACC 23026 TaxID=3028315 RepID=UPI0023AFFBB3|nr:ACT domain-containing protein [Pullulanibacillus sp. KACC 23026]WEG14063.1 ACT domain-containing protein [Pullulanibacillus sp. KACC 23026]
MKKKRERFYLVREDALSESMVKVLEAKKLLERGKVITIKEAVEQVGLSRSAFYKYKDGIFPFHQIVKEEIVTLFCYLEDRPGTLTKLLDKLAQNKGNVLTIHQTIPLQGRANLSLSVDTSMLTINVDDLIQELEQIDEVEKVDIVGTGGI